MIQKAIGGATAIAATLDFVENAASPSRGNHGDRGSLVEKFFSKLWVGD